jgi:UDP-N-acetylglucosamine acyltransferase
MVPTTNLCSSAAGVDPRALVDPRATIDPQATIGPYCVVGHQVRIGAGTRLDNHVTVVGRVTIGENNHIHSGVLIGNLARRGGSAVIGNHNVVREGVTIRLNRRAGDAATTIGDSNYLMACVQIGRGCRLANHVVMANAARLGARVAVADHAFLSGGVLVEGRVSIGREAFISILSHVRRDVPPFMMIEGKPPRPRCVNVVGLQRHGFSPDAIRALIKAHRLVYRERLDLPQAFEALQKAGLMHEAVGELFDFIQARQAGVHGGSIREGKH